ncbi:MAG TPA: endonuclease/exonuclease/phosphatase family protein [Longimicrobiales bacterium]|nr:endonuclease/exonuclease/phosphatase family protein [Longimicrobiales bacterium]
MPDALFLRRFGLMATLALAPAAGACAPVRAEHARPAERSGCQLASDTGAVRWVMPRPAEASPEGWCVAVGTPVLRNRPGSQGAAVDSLLVVTWNTHVGGGDVARLVGDLRAGRITGAPVQDFVLLLQEVYRAGGTVPAVAPAAYSPKRIAPAPADGERADIASSAARLGLSLLYVPSMRNGRSEAGDPAEDRGNAILATRPLGAATAIELPHQAQRRVAIAAEIGARTSAGEAWRLRLASVHLDHRSSWSRIGESFGAGRQHQAAALVAALGDGPATVLGGDLNTWSDERLETAVPYLRAHFPGTPPERGPATFSAGWYARRLDHLFFRLPEGSASEVRRIDDRYGSDHYPLMGWVRPVAAPGAARRVAGRG